MLNQTEQRLEESRKAIEETKRANQKVSELIESGEFQDVIGDNSVNIETAILADVKRQEDAMRKNVSTLILNLDQITSGFGKQFDQMKDATLSEKFIGIFSSKQSKKMREDRISEASFEEQLQEMISESNALLEILDIQKTELENQKVKNLEGLSKSQKSKEETTLKLKELKELSEKLEIPIIDLETKISETTVASERAPLETEIQNLINERNEIISEYDVVLAESQSHEKYVLMYKTYIDSIENQLANQKVLINKLSIDTQNRVILYEATAKSLQTAEQQETAHEINRIGMNVDTATTKTMAVIGSASNHRAADMFESHAGFMKAQGEIMEQKNRSDDRFFERMKDVIDEHEKGTYKD